jgi:N-acetylgalactosamine-N,N'-diacetylbacillosaminyl-diphospho-undecaprenol 4-alpha-N-acetylgalactosaminyltransferase
MKSCIFINSLAAGGAERVISNLCNNGYHADFFVQIWPDDFYTLKNKKAVFLLKRKGFLPFDLILSIYKLFIFIRKNSIGQVNSHLFWANYINAIVAIFTNHKVICTHCVSLESKYDNNLLYYLHSSMIRLFFNKKTLHTFKSSELELEYIKKFKFNNTRVIFNPIDERCDYENELSLELDPDKFYFLCVGRFHKTKMQSNIIQSLQGTNSNIVVVFLGDGPEMQSCKNLTQQLYLEDRIFFVGNVKNPFPYYSKIPYYISASYSEGFPNSLIEAIVSRCFPIHTSCKTGPQEIITSFGTDHGVAISNDIRIYDLGILVPVNDIISLTSSIDYIYKNNPKLKVDAVDRLKNNLDLVKIVKQYNTNFLND